MCNWKLVCQVEDVADVEAAIVGAATWVAVLATEELFLIKVAPVADALVVLAAVAEVAEVVVKFYSTITNK